MWCTAVRRSLTREGAAKTLKRGLFGLVRSLRVWWIFFVVVAAVEVPGGGAVFKASPPPPLPPPSRVFQALETTAPGMNQVSHVTLEVRRRFESRSTSRMT